MVSASTNLSLRSDRAKVSWIDHQRFHKLVRCLMNLASGQGEGHETHGPLSVRTVEK
jgi:hypothetical protein